MSWRNRGNAVRGPNSALTEFLREKGINAAEIRQRALQRHREAEEQRLQETANGAEDEEDEGNVDQMEGVEQTSPARPVTRASRRQRISPVSESDPEEDQADSTTKGKTKAKKPTKKTRKRKRKADDDGDDDDDLDGDYYNPYKKTPKLPGQIEFCEDCGTRFTVTPYTKSAPDGGLLCNACAKKGAAKATPKKTVARRRDKKIAMNNLLDKKGRGAKTLQEMCIEGIAKNIADVESFYGIGEEVMDKICQIICRKRRLKADICTLFFSPNITSLNLYDCANLQESDLITMTESVPQIEHLHLGFAGDMTDAVVDAMISNLKSIKSLHLRGAFLVTKPAYKRLFEHYGKQLESLTLAESVRVNGEVLASLAENCSNLKHLRLFTVPSVDDDALQELAKFTELESLELMHCSEEATDKPLVDILNATGSTLTKLQLAGFPGLTADATTAIKASCKNLRTLDIHGAEDLPPAAIVDLFNSWDVTAPLVNLNVSSIFEMDDEGFRAIIQHCGDTVEELNISKCRHISSSVWEEVIEQKLPKLRSLDVSFVRSVNDGVLEGIARGSPDLELVTVWGNNALTTATQIDKSITIIGREADMHK